MAHFARYGFFIGVGFFLASAIFGLIEWLARGEEPRLILTTAVAGGIALLFMAGECKEEARKERERWMKMSSYDKSNTPHMNDVSRALGHSLEVADPNTCTYCRRACSKGFDRCPTCETDFNLVDVNAAGYRFDDSSKWA